MYFTFTTILRHRKNK